MAPPTVKSRAVYERLKRDIETLRLKPGTKLNEVQLGRELGTSRTPVRDAIKRLASEGLVDWVPGEGARVASISLGGVRALFQFRIKLEPWAAGMVATIAATDEVAQEPFRAVLATVEEFEVSFRSLDSAGQHQAFVEFYEATEAFDQAIIDLCPNQYLARTIRDLRSETVRLRHLSHTGPSRMLVSVEEHSAMLKAVISGDSDAAEEACRYHLTQTLHALLDALTGSEVAAVGALQLT